MEPAREKRAAGRANPAIELNEVTVSYDGGRPVLAGVTLSIEPGNLIAVAGPNGAGKTTLFKAILGIARPQSGWVRVMGKEPRHARRHVAYIPQREQVDWHFPLRAVDVVMMGRVNHIGWRLAPRRIDVQAVESAMRQVGMWELRQSPIDELSGGQRQRLFIARALAGEAPILLLDEPFNEVDAATQALLLDLFESLAARGHTVIVTLHDLEVARRRFPYILFLNRTVVGYGPASQVFNAAVLQQTYLSQVVKWEAGDQQEPGGRDARGSDEFESRGPGSPALAGRGPGAGAAPVPDGSGPAPRT